MLRKYVNTGRILENTDISNLSPVEIVQATADGFTKGLKKRLKSTRRKMLIAVIILQAVAFGVVFYRAGQYRSPVQSSYTYDDY